jgi:acetyl-CoA synthetase
MMKHTRNGTSRASRIPEKFWGKHGKRIDWFKPYTKVKNTSFTGKVSIKWFEDGTPTSPTTASTGTWRSAATRWRSSGKATTRTTTRRSPTSELHDEVCRLRQRDEVERRQEGRPGHHLHADDPEAAYAMLACTRIGAVHSIVFGGFSPDALARPHRRLRINCVITADEGLRGGKQGSAQAQCRQGHRDRRA